MTSPTSPRRPGPTTQRTAAHTTPSWRSSMGAEAPSSTPPSSAGAGVPRAGGAPPVRPGPAWWPGRGRALLSSPFLGGRGGDVGWKVAIDASGAAYVTGHTEDAATGFPTTLGAYDPTHNGRGGG